MPQGSVGIGKLDARYEHKFMKNVCDYGATADGVTDDTAAILSARDACSQGDILFFPRGNFYLSDTITVANNLSVLGSGPFTQLFMASDLDLFNATGAGYVRFGDMRLGSAATSSGKCLIKLNSNVSHYLIENLRMIGSYYGLGIYGAMFGDIMNLQQTGSFYRSGTSANQAWIHAERSGGHSINGTTIISPKIQAGTRGIEISDSGEGTIKILGGLIESVSGEGIYAAGVGLFLSIDGVHFENGAEISLSGCNQVAVENCFLGGTPGVLAAGVSRLSIEDCYSQQLNIDSSCRQVDISRVKFNAAPAIWSANTRLQNLESTGNASQGGWGYYTGQRGSDITGNGDLESWSGGAPTGFAISGSVVQETTIVKRGASAARVTTPGGQLKYNLDAGMFGYSAYKPLTISAWCYKPSSGGGDPRIIVYFNSMATNVPSPSFSIPADTWTRITTTIYVNGITMVNGYVQFYCASTGSCIFDDIVISEEQF